MEIQDVITLVLGLGNFGQTFIIFRGWKSQDRKDKALANQEEGTFVKTTQEIYNTLAADLKKETEKMVERIRMQDLAIDVQNKVVDGLKRELNDYKEKCKKCNHNLAQ